MEKLTIAFLFSIAICLYIFIRENNFSWHVRKAQYNIIRRIQRVVPKECVDEVVDIVSEELEALMKG